MNEQDKKNALREAKGLIASDRPKEAIDLLRATAEPNDDFVLQCRYASLFKKIRCEALDLDAVRVAIAASSTTDHLLDVMRFWLGCAGLNAQLYQAPFDTVFPTILDPASQLYQFEPDVMMIFTNHRDVKCRVEPGSSAEQVDKAVCEAVQPFKTLWRTLRDNCSCHVLQNNADVPCARVFGNYEGGAGWSATNLFRRFNLQLASDVDDGVTVFDLDFLSSLYGKAKWFDGRYWHHSKHAFTPDATGLVAHAAAMTIAAIRGRAKKCLVLDLDNTLWGGVVADDGVDRIELGDGVNGQAYAAFQRYLLELKGRGIVLAVCSKNDHDKAIEPFNEHPDMQITLKDIAVFKANWHNKADNIRQIAAELNLGLDSVVFVDDNPAERELVRRLLPMVSVCELPQDATGYVAALSSQCYFETVSFSPEDAARSDYYRSNAARQELAEEFTDLSEYLQSLEMTATVGSFDSFNLPRVAQLINKSNQFHLTTTRYSQARLEAMMEEPDLHCLCFTLADRFGDNGLICAVILRDRPGAGLFIDTWVMSCRVLGRGMEEFVCSEIVHRARRLGYSRLLGGYVPTRKNRLVSDLYERLGFELLEDNGGATEWLLDLESAACEYHTFIRKMEPQLAGAEDAL